MPPTIFQTPHHRPTKLSNPHRHFSQSTVDRIIQSDDEHLTWSDFKIIFHWGTPAGSYDEIVYFLPLALRLMKNNPRDSLEFMPGVLCFIEHEIQRLESDSLDQSTRRAIEEIFQAWTSRFVVVHYDVAACRAKGWTLDHDDIVENSQSVLELVENLQTFPAFPEFADELITSLAIQQEYPIQSAWFLEYARLDSSIRLIEVTPAQRRLIEDRVLLQDHYDRIARTIVPRTASPTYWPDLRISLGLLEP
jgi:hypothetical protein